MKKVISSLFILSLLPIIYFVLFQKEVSNLAFYYVTMATLIFGVMLYPLNLNFNSKKDFLIIPIAAYLVLSIANMFLMKEFNEKISVINLLMGLFSFGQYCLQKPQKTSANKGLH
ncbi:MAG: hypothetical protein QM564_08210 [Bergeyella sp.]